MLAVKQKKIIANIDLKFFICLDVRSWHKKQLVFSWPAAWCALIIFFNNFFCIFLIHIVRISNALLFSSSLHHFHFIAGFHNKKIIIIRNKFLTVGYCKKRIILLFKIIKNDKRVKRNKNIFFLNYVWIINKLRLLLYYNSPANFRNFSRNI